MRAGRHGIKKGTAVGKGIGRGVDDADDQPARGEIKLVIMELPEHAWEVDEAEGWETIREESYKCEPILQFRT